ncbi:hypothetical protein [Oceanobacter antarcticus]|uniref:Uncharacterized protein n=1 Tax=Oceanobacter antarcticus TaxID=3133425 RepID=A0ABW8NJI5_9GAMM
MTVTRAELDALRASLAKPELQLTFTPDNGIATQVHTELFQKQQSHLKQGEHSLRQAQESLRNELKKLRSNAPNRDELKAADHTHVFNHKL